MNEVLLYMVIKLLSFIVIIGLLVLFIHICSNKGKAKKKKEIESEKTLSDSEAKIKELEIEKMDAHSVASTSAKSDALLRDKDQLKQEFGKRADSIAEDFFRK